MRSILIVALALGCSAVQAQQAETQPGAQTQQQQQQPAIEQVPPAETPPVTPPGQQFQTNRPLGRPFGTNLPPGRPFTTNPPPGRVFEGQVQEPSGATPHRAVPPATRRDQPIQERDRPIQERDRPIQPRDKPIQPREFIQPDQAGGPAPGGAAQPGDPGAPAQPATRLQTVLGGISTQTAATALQKTQLQEALMASVPGGVQVPDQLITQLANDLTTHLAQVNLGREAQLQLAGSLERILNANTLGPQQIEGALAEVQKLLIEGRLAPAAARTIVRDLHAIAAELAGPEATITVPR